MRKQTKQVKVKEIIIGGGFPVSIQTMWKYPLTLPIDQVLTHIEKLKSLGCDIIRFAVPTRDSATYVGEIARRSVLPIVADIHFDFRIGLDCMEYPVAKVRINPGNIGSAKKVEQVIKKAMDTNTPLRIGVNGGSLPKTLITEKDAAIAMVKAAEMELEFCEKFGYTNLIFSLKASDIETTIRANELFSEKYHFPLHLGVTEAGPLVPGTVKNSIAIAFLLKKGIGDTIRVSLSDSMENEVIVGKQILTSLDLKDEGVRLVSCPTCSRTEFNVREFIGSINEKCMSIKNNMTIAVMGCPVNGPGEAKKADLGITGSGNYAVIFKEGVIIKKIALTDAPEVFCREIDAIINERKEG